MFRLKPKTRNIKPKLFIGITSWNSESFLDVCLRAISKTCADIDHEVVVFDNCSTDQSVDIARKFGARVIVKPLNQGRALNFLLNSSNAKHTLLMHADTVLLSNNWYETVVSNFDQDTVMASPEDIGCGLMSRHFGKGHPESSFMFFDTRKVNKFKRWKVISRRFMIPLKLEKHLNFYGPHITHELSKTFAKKDKKLLLMNVLYSNTQVKPAYDQPEFPPSNWLPALAHLQYGLGNFYSLGDTVTHYHNWYDRVSAHQQRNGASTTEADNRGYPVSFIKAYSQQFIQDYYSGIVSLPTIGQLPAEDVIAKFDGETNVIS